MIVQLTMSSWERLQKLQERNPRLEVVRKQIKDHKPLVDINLNGMSLTDLEKECKELVVTMLSIVEE